MSSLRPVTSELAANWYTILRPSPTPSAIIQMNIMYVTLIGILGSSFNYHYSNHGVRHGQKFGRANTEYIVYNNYDSL